MKLLVFIFLLMGSCTSIYYTKDFWWSVEFTDGKLSETKITPILLTIPATSIFPTFTSVPTSSSLTKIPSPTREVYASATFPPIFLTSTLSPTLVPTIGLCAGIVTDSLFKRKSPSPTSTIMGGVKRGDIVQFSEYSQDGQWLHLLDGSWIRIRNQGNSNILYADVGAC